MKGEKVEQLAMFNIAFLSPGCQGGNKFLCVCSNETNEVNRFSMFLHLPKLQILCFLCSFSSSFPRPFIRLHIFRILWLLLFFLVSF